jgi:iron complex outermembrane receptor protein
LYATQPQSVITREFIEQSVAPTAEYSRVVVIAPSLSGNSSNGPGLSETKIIMRGFSDDQYNITFDGIPWGDTNNPAHHSTSFFPASVIGGAVVERGPGNASNIGFATFGGSINLFSKKPSAEQSTAVFGSLGNWGTELYGISPRNRQDCWVGRRHHSAELSASELRRLPERKRGQQRQPDRQI